MSIASEIMSAASEIAGHDVSGGYGKTIVSALDALTDACAGENVESGKTIAGAIRKLVPYIGTGGSLSAGPLAMVVTAEGDDKVYNWADLSSGGTAIASFATGADENPAMVAAGIDVRLDLQSTRSNVTSAACYNYDADEEDFIPTAFTDYTAENGVITFTMPEITSNDVDYDPGWILFNIMTLG